MKTIMHLALIALTCVFSGSLQADGARQVDDGKQSMVIMSAAWEETKARWQLCPTDSGTSMMACLGESLRDGFHSAGWPHMASIEQASGYLRTAGQSYDDGSINAEVMFSQMKSIVVKAVLSAEDRLIEFDH